MGTQLIVDIYELHHNIHEIIHFAELKKIKWRKYDMNSKVPVTEQLQIFANSGNNFDIFKIIVYNYDRLFTKGFSCPQLNDIIKKKLHCLYAELLHRCQGSDTSLFYPISLELLDDAMDDLDVEQTDRWNELMGNIIDYQDEASYIYCRFNTYGTGGIFYTNAISCILWSAVSHENLTCLSLVNDAIDYMFYGYLQNNKTNEWDINNYSLAIRYRDSLYKKFYDSIADVSLSIDDILKQKETISYKTYDNISLSKCVDNIEAFRYFFLNYTDLKKVGITSPEIENMNFNKMLLYCNWMLGNIKFKVMPEEIERIKIFLNEFNIIHTQDIAQAIQFVSNKANIIARDIINDTNPSVDMPKYPHVYFEVTNMFNYLYNILIIKNEQKTKIINIIKATKCYIRVNGNERKLFEELYNILKK